MNTFIRKLLLLLVLVILPMPVFAIPESPTGYVNDTAGMLTPGTVEELEQALSDFASSTQHQIAVVTVPNLEGDYIEHYAVTLFEKWGIGAKGSDNGVLFLVAKAEREVRIEVGYGLEGTLPDAIASRIITDIVTPKFKTGDYDGGVRDGVLAITNAVRGVTVNIPVKSKAGSSELLSLFFQNIEFLAFALYALVMFCASVFARSKSWWLGGAVGGVIGVIIGTLAGFYYSGVIALLVLVPLGLLFDYIVSRGYSSSVLKGQNPPWWTGGRGMGGGGSSFRGFGGGRSGGGGATGSW